MLDKFKIGILPNIKADEDCLYVYIDHEGGEFIGKIEKEDGKWKESKVKGNPPYGWGGKSYMGYMTKKDVMNWLVKDYDSVEEIDEDDLEEREEDINDEEVDAANIKKDIKADEKPDAFNKEIQKSGKNGYTVDDVRKAGFTLEPMECKYCGSKEVVYNQYSDSALCEECGKDQDGKVESSSKAKKTKENIKKNVKASTYTDFIENNAEEIKEAKSQIKKMYAAGFANKIDEEKAKELLKVYDEIVAEYVYGWAVDGKVETNELADLGLRISDKFGTEPHQVLNAINDLYMKTRKELNIKEDDDDIDAAKKEKVTISKGVDTKEQRMKSDYKDRKAISNDALLTSKIEKLIELLPKDDKRVERYKKMLSDLKDQTKVDKKLNEPGRMENVSNEEDYKKAGALKARKIKAAKIYDVNDVVTFHVNEIELPEAEWGDIDKDIVKQHDGQKATITQTNITDADHPFYDIEFGDGFILPGVNAQHIIKASADDVHTLALAVFGDSAATFEDKETGEIKVMVNKEIKLQGPEAEVKTKLEDMYAEKNDLDAGLEHINVDETAEKLVMSIKDWIDEELKDLDPEVVEDDKKLKEILKKAFKELSELFSINAKLDKEDKKSLIAIQEDLDSAIRELRDVRSEVDSVDSRDIDPIISDLQRVYKNIESVIDVNASIKSNISAMEKKEIDKKLKEIFDIVKDKVTNVQTKSEIDNALQELELAIHESPQILADDVAVDLIDKNAKDIFDVAEGLPIGNGYMAHKDANSNEIYVLDNKGTEVLRVPNVFLNDMANIIELFRVILKLETPADNTGETLPATAPGVPAKLNAEDSLGQRIDKIFDQKDGKQIELEEKDKEDEEEVDEAVKEEDDEEKEEETEPEGVTEEQLAELKRQINEKSNKAKEIVTYMIKSNKNFVSAVEIQKYKTPGESLIFAKQRAVEVKQSKVYKILLDSPDATLDLFIDEKNNGNVRSAFNMQAKILNRLSQA